jgi:hypothetical protein
VDMGLETPRRTRCHRHGLNVAIVCESNCGLPIQTNTALKGTVQLKKIVIYMVELALPRPIAGFQLRKMSCQQ